MVATTLRQIFPLALLLLSSAGCARAQTATAPATPATPATPAGTDTIEVIFDKKPIERGLSFDRAGVKAGTLALPDGPVNAWVAKSSIVPGKGWMRSFRFKVTDPRFQNGKRPAVDVEVVYYLENNVQLDARADTNRGSRRVGGGGGKAKTWKTARYTLDDAFFGARSYPDDELGTSGFDLRINTTNGELWLKSVKIIGYNPAKDVDWNRLLQLRNARAQTPGGVLAFTRGKGRQLSFELQSNATVARPLRYEARISGYDNRVRFQKKGELTVAPSSAAQLELALDTTDWPLGPYDGSMAFFLDEKSTEPILSEEFRVGVVSDTVLPKARAGDYLFGLDAGNTYNIEVHDATALAYYRLMGVDVLRDVFSDGSARDVEDAGASLQLLGREELQAGIMVSPPKKSGEAALAQVTAQLEEMARLYAGKGPGKLYFWELGNEPDLTGFYAGTMPEYIAAMTAMSDAIKRGAGAQPTAVMNGGLSFAGTGGKRRSAEFIAGVPADKIDLLAYHAHGPGIETERKSWLRTKALIDERGMGWNLIDTESGYSGHNRNGKQLQAATVVEKKRLRAIGRNADALFFPALQKRQRQRRSVQPDRQPRRAAPLGFELPQHGRAAALS